VKFLGDAQLPRRLALWLQQRGHDVIHTLDLAQQNLYFLNYLRSSEKGIHAFAESRRGRRRRTQTSQPTGLPTDAILDPGSQP